MQCRGKFYLIWYEKRQISSLGIQYSWISAILWCHWLEELKFTFITFRYLRSSPDERFLTTMNNESENTQNLEMGYLVIHLTGFIISSREGTWCPQMSGRMMYVTKTSNTAYTTQTECLLHTQTQHTLPQPH